MWSVGEVEQIRTVLCPRRHYVTRFTIDVPDAIDGSPILSRTCGHGGKFPRHLDRDVYRYWTRPVLWGLSDVQDHIIFLASMMMSSVIHPLVGRPAKNSHRQHAV